MKLKLETPTITMKQQFIDYINEWRQHNEKIVPSSSDPQENTYEAWLEKTYTKSKKETCPPDLVPANMYFLLDDDKLIGMIQIRHSLNDYLFNFGGHIGYGVRPSKRGKGYAKLMLKLALDKCKNLKIDKVLITCDKDNPASAKTILANGGILENEVSEKDKIVQRYWINC